MTIRRVSLVALAFLCAAACRDRSIPREAPDSRDSLIALGENLYTNEQYDSALVTFNRAQQVSADAKDEARQARSMAWIGLVSARLGDPRAAEQIGRQALTIKKRIGLEREMAFSYHSLGLALLDMDRNDEAKTSFIQSLQAARRSNDSTGMAKAYGGLGLADAYLGNLQQSQADQRLAREIAHRIGDSRLEANALANDAMVDLWEGNSLPAVATLDSARILYRQSRYGAGEQNALGQLATAHELTGREDLALAALDSSLALSRRLRLREPEADALRLIGGVHLRLGNYREALNTFIEADSMMRRTGLDANLGSLVRAEAEARFHLGDLPGAKRDIDAALTLHVRSAEPLERLDDLLLAAEIEHGISGSVGSTRRIHEARKLADSIHTRGSRISVVLAEAHIADLEHDARSVLASLDGIASDLAAGDLGVEWSASALQARAYARLGRLDSARVAGTRAVTAVDRLRGELASQALRSTYIADRADVYGDLVVTFLRLGQTDEAFRIADAARSRSLLDHLRAVQPDTTSNRTTAQVVEEERVLARVDSLVQRLRATDRSSRNERGTAAGTPASVQVELARARHEYEALVARASQTNRRSTAILGAGALRTGEVRAALSADEALIEYMLLSDRVLIFIVTRDSLRVVSSSLNAAALVQRTRLLGDIWGHSSRDWRLGLPASSELFNALVAPVVATRALRDSRRLVVVPHGILGEVPFAALMNRSTGRFLIQDFAITELPTAAALPALRSQMSLQSGDPGGYGFAPFNRLDQLPASGAELAAFRSTSSNRNIVLGHDATEEAVRRALTGSGIVHVATHGVMNLQSPLFSRVELTPIAGGGPRNNGRLEVHELLGLVIRSPLVFLSGCETGAGLEWLNDPVRGTADLTLAQALLSAGAANVITTLWRIGDSGAARFSELFYSNLKTLSLIDSFAATQRAMARDARYRSPYYWAGFVLAGDGRFSTVRKMR